MLTYYYVRICATSMWWNKKDDFVQGMFSGIANKCHILQRCPLSTSFQLSSAIPS